jgi:hypothetical protein
MSGVFSDMLNYVGQELTDKCEAGCKSYDGGERRHHKDCAYYNDSFTKRYDDLAMDYKALIKKLEVADELAKSIDNVIPRPIGTTTYWDEPMATVVRILQQWKEIK